MSEKLAQFLIEAEGLVRRQPETSWTVARMKLCYPGHGLRNRMVAVDNVVALGKCNAQATRAFVNEERARIEVETVFSDFELVGRSNLIGKFRILLQDGKAAQGSFHQRFSETLFPMLGEWRVPFTIETEMGLLRPRDGEEVATLKCAEPGEYHIPPLGTWFEKWDPISLVLVGGDNDNIIAVVEHAMHIMLFPGDGPKLPEYING